jgi:hypothetical protein
MASAKVIPIKVKYKGVEEPIDFTFPLGKGFQGKANLEAKLKVFIEKCNDSENYEGPYNLEDLITVLWVKYQINPHIQGTVFAPAGGSISTFRKKSSNEKAKAQPDTTRSYRIHLHLPKSKELVFETVTDLKTNRKRIRRILRKEGLSIKDFYKEDDLAIANSIHFYYKGDN